MLRKPLPANNTQFAADTPDRGSTALRRPLPADTLRGEILALAGDMTPISLSEMKGIKLMNRIDTKFLADETDLRNLLEMAQDHYFVQEIDGRRVGRYDTIYYDTGDLDMFVCHHNRKLRRQKIRTRTYVDSGLVFLEIKNKNNRGRTKKVRTSVGQDDFRDFKGNPAAVDFIYNESKYPLDGISPHLRTSFNRITLVNKRKTERLTIDMDLCFENLRTGQTQSLPGVVIVELKQDGLCYSEMKDILLELRVQPRKVSKYCVGTTLTNQSVKSNRFKEKVRYIMKLSNVQQLL